MGFVYYGHYARYFEIARVEAIRSLGFDYKDFELQEGIILPVSEYQVKYIKPAYYDELLRIESEVRDYPDSYRFIFHHRIFNPGGALLCKAKIVLYILDGKSLKPTALPLVFSRKLGAFFKIRD